MTRNEARTQHLANALAGITGVAFLYFKYFAKSTDPYSSAGHPLEPVAHNLHVLLSPLLLFAVGLIWADHVWKKIQRGRQKRRQSGVLMAALFGPMALSAYAIQVSVDETTRKTWATIHIATSIVWMVGYIIHLALKPVKSQP